MPTTRLLHTLTGHRAAIYALAPGAGGRILSAGGDGWVVEWDLAAPDLGRVAAAVETQLFSLCALPGARQLVAGNMNGGVHWIDLDRPEATRNVQHHGTGVYAIIAVGDAILTAGGDGVLTRWSVAERRTVESLQLSRHALRALAWAPGRGELAVGASDGCIYLLDAGTLALRRRLDDAHPPSVFAVAYSPDEQRLLSGGRDAQLRVWDLADDFRTLVQQPAHWFTINHIAWAPDGRRFATASRDKTIKLWDGATYALLKVIEIIRDGGHVNSVNRLLWTPDALVSASDDRTLKVWAVDR
jgi:WD40 repeat protein